MANPPLPPSERTVIFCEIVDGRRFLEVCQHLCVQRKQHKKQLGEYYYECSVAINQYRCPVVKRLFPKGADKHDGVESLSEDGATKPVRGTSTGRAKRSPSTRKPRRVSNGKGHKEKTVPKKGSGSDASVLPPLPDEGVPRPNKRGTKRKRVKRG